ncbi:MAG: DUF2934 domain-containing protein [Acidobacteriaceae bacterium]|nr:DUF2934 domain-containing protein [Acidobacteriaceae bacterium]
MAGTEKKAKAPAKTRTTAASAKAPVPAAKATKTAAKAPTTAVKAPVAAAKKTATKGVSVAKSVTAKKPASKSAPTQFEIEQLAYSFWVERGHHGGYDVQDWLRAERELMGNR